MLLLLLRVLRIKWISKVVDYSIAIFLLNVKYVEYAKPTIQTLIHGNTSLASEVLNPLFLPYFYNSFRCFSLIMLGGFNLFLPVVQNLIGPTILCSVRDIPYWYHTYFWYLCKKYFTVSGLTDNIFPSVPSCSVSLISVQKWHPVVRCWGQ